jgi:hypothetical protein
VPALLATQTGNTTPFQVHSDMAPAVYLDGNPSRTAPVTRQFERDIGSLTATNPITATTGPISDRLVDRVGMNALHMVTGDPLRTPTFIDFLDPNYFGFAGSSSCSSPCVTAPGSWDHSTFAWNHGGYTPDIVNIWAGVVGPGVSGGGNNTTWVDHTDLRPTILTLLGLTDDYLHDGRVITEILDRNALPQTLRAHNQKLAELAGRYKQINAPLGRFGLDVIKISDAALRSSDEAHYAQLEDAIASINSQRDSLAAQMRAMLEQAAFAATPIDNQQAKRLISQADDLLARADALAASS